VKHPFVPESIAMSKRASWFQLCLLVLALGSKSAFAIPNFTFELIPTGGGIAGPAGAPQGWGYRIENPDPLNWLETTSVTSDPFAQGTATVLFDFPILSPSSSVTLGWQSGTQGLFEFIFDPATPSGFTNIGSFALEGAFWSADPLDPIAILVAGANTQFATYAVTSGSIAAVVPEPTTLHLLVACMVGAVASGRFRRKEAANETTWKFRPERSRCACSRSEL
jgi:hypothetical protein